MLPRPELIRSLLNPQGVGLEIGPSHAPEFSKRQGYTVETLDYQTADEIRAKYAGHPIDFDAIEEADYISDGRPMEQVIGKRAAYDFIFSSHVIEHVTDFIGYFESCDVLLKPDGVVVLAIPDKRFTFDALQPLTSTGDVLQAHAERRTRHTAGAIFDFNANLALMDGHGTWARGASGSIATQYDIHHAYREFQTALGDPDPYRDIHAWRLTPASLRLIMHDLAELGLTPFREVAMIEYGVLEFYVAYSRTGVGHGLDRLELCRQVQRELAEESAI